MNGKKEQIETSRKIDKPKVKIELLTLKFSCPSIQHNLELCLPFFSICLQKKYATQALVLVHTDKVVVPAKVLAQNAQRKGLAVCCISCVL